MKKTLIALAAVAVSSAAMAQVTMSGSINARYQNSNITGVAADKVNGLHFSDSEIRFNFSEDLGGGLKAAGSFGFENGTDQKPAVGSGASLGVSGGFGSVTFSNMESSDYLAVDQVTTSGFSNGTVNDRLTYSSPSIMGARLSVIYSDGNGTVGTLAGSNDNKSTVFSIDYANGPLTANIGMESVDKSLHATTDGGTRFKVGYNFGVAAVTFGSVRTKDNKAVNRTETAATVSVPLGAITASYAMATSKTGNAAKLDGSNLTVAYALSKRTSVSINRIGYETSTVKNAYINRVNLSHSF